MITWAQSTERISKKKSLDLWVEAYFFNYFNDQMKLTLNYDEQKEINFYQQKT